MRDLRGVSRLVLAKLLWESLGITCQGGFSEYKVITIFFSRLGYLELGALPIQNSRIWGFYISTKGVIFGKGILVSPLILGTLLMVATRSHTPFTVTFLSIDPCP